CSNYQSACRGTSRSCPLNRGANRRRGRKLVSRGTYKGGISMRNRKKLLVKMLVYGVAGMVELANLGTAKSCQSNSVVDRGDRFLFWTGFPRLRRILWRSLGPALTFVFSQLAAPYQGYALPNPIAGAFEGGRVATDAAPEGVLSAGGVHTC